MHTTLSANRYLQKRDEIVLQKKTVASPLSVHDHEFIEIAYIAKGQGEHHISGKGETVRRGDLFVISQKVPHQFIGNSHEPLTVYNCIFEPFAIDSSMDIGDNFFDVVYRYLFHSTYGKENPRDYLRLTVTKKSELERALEEMYTEYTNQSIGYALILRSDLIKLLVFIFRLCLKDTVRHRDLPDFHRFVIENTHSYLNEHYAEPITNGFLAARSYISEGYFRRIYKSVTGTTLIDTLQDIRCQKACILLENGNEAVSAIAKKVGYSDLKYFYSVFFKKKGCTPGEYRRKMRRTPPKDE